MVLKSKEFRSGVIRGVDENMSIFFRKNKLTKSQIISVTYSVNNLGTYALVVYEVKSKKGLKRR